MEKSHYLTADPIVWLVTTDKANGTETNTVEEGLSQSIFYLLISYFFNDELVCFQ